MADRLKIENYNVAQLERVLFFYPWYSYARVKLIEKLAELTPEQAEQKARESVAYHRSLSQIAQILEHAEKEEPEKENVLDFEQISSITRGDEQGVKYVLAGGDYFSPEELRTVEQQEIKRSEQLPDGTPPHIPEFDISDFYTETLAKIYTEQGYYEEAIKAYAKLILLYPEKSAYFAALVEEIKLKKS